MLRWRIAILVSAAIAISYLDRQTLPWAINAIQADIPISNQVKAFLDSAFLVSYGVMYLGGGRLLDFLGTRRGFLVVMIFWSLACASHGVAGGVFMLAASRLLLGLGEGGGFPAATRAVAEWFPAHERATAMGIINAGSAVGGIVAPPLIALVLTQVHWLHLASWRWVFFLTGGLGLLWTLWWWRAYFPPDEHPDVLATKRHGVTVATDQPSRAPIGAMETHSQPQSLRAFSWQKQSELPGPASPTIPLARFLQFREVWGVIAAKFLSDAAWYFYLFWLPKYLFDVHHFDLRTAGSVGWIPYAAAGVGCMGGGLLSSRLLRRGRSVNAARKIALGASAALMPWVMLVPHTSSIAWVIALFSLAYCGQQSWSTIVMILPTDLVPRQAVGTFAGLIGLGGAMGGIALGQLAGWLLDHGFSYTPVLILASSLHVIAFGVICLTIPKIQPLELSPVSS
jgi:MFS transporter, ACS family, hexuronate transporter